ncbi:MAG: hypothetical protein ABI321_25040 [Polyangia bacterium]
MSGPNDKKPPADSDDDWLNALDEWDAQIDDALGQAPSDKPLQMEQDPAAEETQLTVAMLPPVNVDPEPLDPFAMDLATSPELRALPEDELPDLFAGGFSLDETATPDTKEPIVTTADASSPEDEPMHLSDELAIDDEPFGASTRVGDAREMALLLAREAPYDDADDVIIERVLDRVEESPPEPPAEYDDDFYDDISIVPGRDEPSIPKQSPVRVAERDEEPIWNEPPVVQDRPADDPDRTPLPLAEEIAGEKIALRTVATTRQPTLSQRDLRALRPTRPIEDGPFHGIESGVPVVLLDDERRELRGLLDTERLLQEGDRAADLAFESAWLSTRLGDEMGAWERADAVLATRPAHPGALAIARRCALSRSDLERADELLGRELPLASAAERVALTELAVAVADARGQHERARNLDAPSAGAAALGIAFSRDEVQAAALRGYVTDSRLLGALDVWSARHLRGEQADAKLRSPDIEPRNLHAALLAWRMAVQTNRAESTALEQLAEALPPSALRSAVERRAVGAAFAENAPDARTRLAALANAGDETSALWWSLDPIDAGVEDADVVRLQLGLAQLADPGQRAALRFAIGVAEEARDHVGAAIAAYSEAVREFPAGRRAERALERARARGGDKQAALSRQLRTAALGDLRASWALSRAASLLVELDRPEEALARIEDALRIAPVDGEALALHARIVGLLGKAAQGAEQLLIAADSTPDADLATSLRQRAAAAFAASGEPSRAIDVALEAGGGLDEQLDAVRRYGVAAPERLREALSGLAQAAAPAVAHVWVERATLAQGDDALEDLRRAVTLRPEWEGPAAWASAIGRKSAGSATVDLLVERAEQLAARDDVPRALRRMALLDASLALAADRDDLTAAVELIAKESWTSDPALAVERLRLARRRGREPGLRAAYDVALAAEPSPERQAMLLYDLARAHRRAGDADRELDRLRAAADAMPDARVYRDILERTLERIGDTAKLSDLALADLKGAPDTRSKVAAYERLAFIDECLRGDVASARMSYESIAELDQNDQDAARRLERSLIGERRYVDLVHLYDGMGIAAQDPQFAVAVTLERARLRSRVAGEGLDANELEAAIDNDLRLALFQDPRSRPALRQAYARAVERRDAARRLELAVRLAELAATAVPPDNRASAIFSTRAAESSLALGRDDDAKDCLVAANARAEAHLPGLLLRLELALRSDDLPAAADSAEQVQRVQREPVARREAGLLAAALAAGPLVDRPRAIRILRAALEADPRGDLAFTRLRELLQADSAWAELGELFGQRLGVEIDGRKLLELRVDMAQLQRLHLSNSTRAREELTAALRQDANHPEALLYLADLEQLEGNHQAAADLLLRRAKLEKQRDPLADLLFRLGELYVHHLADSKRAIACLVRVLQLQPDRKDALVLIAEAYGAGSDWPGVLGALQRLANLETDTHRRVALLHRAASVQEEGFKEPRQALMLYRAALELNPTYLPAVEALARYFDRQSDVQSLRVLVDTTARRLRQGLSGGPRDAGVFHALFRIFTLRRAPDRAAMAAGVLDWMGAIEIDERAALERLRTRDQSPGAALADPALDDYLFDGRVPPGVRYLLRMLDEPLTKSMRADVRNLGLSRSDRLPKSGHAVRDVANRIAADLGLRDLDVYVSPALTTTAVLELTDPLSLCIGQGLLDGAHELELRFLFARYFKLAQLGLAVPLRLDPQALAALVAGVVRQFVPDFQPAGIDATLISAEAARITKLLPKKLLGELHAFALECATPSFDLLAISAGLAAAADRAGLLACGAPGPALTMLERMGAADAARALAIFAIGDELPHLRQLVGTSLG